MQVNITRAIRTLSRRREHLVHEMELASKPQDARRRTWMAGEVGALDVAIPIMEEKRLQIHEYRAARCRYAE